MKRVLIPLDGTYLSQEAANYAATLAKRWELSVELFHWSPPGAIGHAPSAERETAQQIYALADKLRQEGLQVDTTIDHVSHGNLAAAIADAVAARPIELVVMSTHGPAGVMEGMFGSQAEQVSRGVDVPVLIVPTATPRSWTDATSFTVLIPLDGSEVSEQALKPAFEIASNFNGSICLTRIVDPASEAGDAGALTRATQHARDYLRETSAKLEGKGVLVEQVYEIGCFLETLEDIVQRKGADLLVMGTHARQGFLRLLQGSDTEAVVNRSSIPVLVIPARAA